MCVCLCVARGVGAATDFALDFVRVIVGVSLTLSCLHCITAPLKRFFPNLHGYVIWTYLKADQILAGLAFFQGHLRCGDISFL